LRFLRKAIGHHGVPDKITIDKSGANKAAIESYNAEHQADVEILASPVLVFGAERETFPLDCSALCGSDALRLA
jgi:transposase-like protein